MTKDHVIVIIEQETKELKNLVEQQSKIILELCNKIKYLENNCAFLEKTSNYVAKN